MATEPLSHSAERLPLAEVAYRSLRDRIVRLDLRPGEVLSEEALARALGVGRTPIREAIKRLSREGLVVVLPRRGTLVSEINVHHPTQVTEVRAVLEPLAARLAAERISDNDRPGIRALRIELEEFQPGDSWQKAMDLDGEAHRMVYRLANNPLLAETLDTYYNLACRIWYAMLDRMPASMVKELERHSALLAAVSRGDAAGAEELSRGHVSLATSYNF